MLMPNLGQVRPSQEVRNLEFPTVGRWNTARDILETFRRELSVLVPQFPALFPLPFGECRAKYLDVFEKSGAGEENRTPVYSLGRSLT
jgi:hypothetical protein